MKSQVFKMVLVVADFAKAHGFTTIITGMYGMWGSDTNVKCGRKGWDNCISKDVSRAKARCSVEEPEHFALSGGVCHASDSEKFVADLVVAACALAWRTTQRMRAVGV